MDLYTDDSMIERLTLEVTMIKSCYLLNLRDYSQPRWYRNHPKIQNQKILDLQWPRSTRWYWKHQCLSKKFQIKSDPDKEPVRADSVMIYLRENMSKETMAVVLNKLGY